MTAFTTHRRQREQASSQERVVRNDECLDASELADKVLGVEKQGGKHDMDRTPVNRDTDGRRERRCTRVPPKTRTATTASSSRVFERFCA